MSSPRKLVRSVVLLFCVSSVLAQTRESRLESIRSALRGKDFDKAIELSRAALQDSPKNAQLWTLEGIALASKGDSEGALSAFTEALRISPDNLAALEGAAQVEYQAGHRAAVPLLDHLLRLNPANQVAHAMLAVLEYREGNCGSAASHFEEAGELINSQRDALHAYATCLVRGKKLDQAEQVFERALALHPDDPQERRLLASLQLMLQRPKDALKTLQPAMDTRDPGSQTLSLASAAYEDAGDTPNAVSTLRQAILLDPRNVSLYLDFAIISTSTWRVNDKLIEENDIGQNILYRNNGDGTFTDVTRTARLWGEQQRWGAGCSFLDYNRDGHLDLFVSNYVRFSFEHAPVPGASRHCRNQ